MDMDPSRRLALRFLGLGALTLALKPILALARPAERFEARRQQPPFVTEPSPGNITVADLSARSGIRLGIGAHPSGIGDFVYTVNGQGVDPEDHDGWLFGLGRDNNWQWPQGHVSVRTVVPEGQRVFWALDSVIEGPHVPRPQQFRRR